MRKAERSGTLKAFMTLFLLIFMAIFGAKAPTAQVDVLRTSAQEMMRQGQPQKALALLQQARRLDSAQQDIDVLMKQCRVRLGLWVPPGEDVEWMDPEDPLETVLRQKPDSLFAVAKKRLQHEDFPGALRILQPLSFAHGARAVFVQTYQEAQAKQEERVQFHQNLAERALQAGQFSEGVQQWTMALSARPADPILQANVIRAKHNRDISVQSYQTLITGALQTGNDTLALRMAQKARLAHPEVARFGLWGDSLQVARNQQILSQLREVQATFDSGQGQSALQMLEAMIQYYPQETSLLQVRQNYWEQWQVQQQKRRADSLEQATEKALLAGNLEQATLLIVNAPKQELSDQKRESLRNKIDSAQQKEKSQSVVSSALMQSRKALARGDKTAARTALQKALVAQPENPTAKRLSSSLNSLLQAQDSLRNRERISASPEVESPTPAVKPTVPVPASKKDPDRAKVNGLVLAGITAYRSGDYKQAMVHWKQALVLDPKNAQAMKYLENVGRKQERLQ